MDDDEMILDTLTAMLGGQGRVLRARGADEALAQLGRFKVDVAFVDLHLGLGLSGLELLDQIRARWMDIEVVICTVDKDPRQAVAAIKRGAFDYITKEFANLAELANLVERALDRQRARREVIYLRGELAQRGDSSQLVVGRSEAMRVVVDNALRVAPLPSTVLLLGESGTGKEVLAHLIHRESSRSERPFVAVNVAAVPRELLESHLFGHEKGSFTGAINQQIGKFELADGGTLFLDEIGDLPLELQPKLLRALQEREIERLGAREPISIDVRLIAATHVDLAAAVKEGRFREDLYYRLNIVPLRVPPLRERREDIPELLGHFGRKHARRLRRSEPVFTEEANAILSAYHWPGNVRELENLVERMLALSERPQLEAEDIPLEYHYPSLEQAADASGDLYEVAIAAFEKSFLKRVLASCGYSPTRTAKRLGLHRNTLRYKLEKYRLRPSPDRDEG